MMKDRNPIDNRLLRSAAWFVLSLFLLIGRGTAAGAPEGKPLRPKNGILNFKAVVLGGAFRVTTVIPLHGDFSKFDRVDIVQTRSLIGQDAPPALLEGVTEKLRAEIERTGRFSRVNVVGALPKHSIGTTAKPVVLSDRFSEADSLEAPMGTWKDLLSFDEQRRLAAQLQNVEGQSNALVVAGEVLDFSKGNKLLQLLFLDLGNATLTVRFSYFDEETGEELGRQVVSSDNSSMLVPSLVTSRGPLTGIAEGMVDQVSRRKVAAEQ